MTKYYLRLNRNDGNEQLWKRLEHSGKQNVTDANDSEIYRAQKKYNNNIMNVSRLHTYLISLKL